MRKLKKLQVDRWELNSTLKKKSIMKRFCVQVKINYKKYRDFQKPSFIDLKDVE